MAVDKGIGISGNHCMARGKQPNLQPGRNTFRSHKENLMDAKTISCLDRKFDSTLKMFWRKLLLFEGVRLF